MIWYDMNHERGGIKMLEGDNRRAIPQTLWTPTGVNPGPRLFRESNRKIFLGRLARALASWTIIVDHTMMLLRDRNSTRAAVHIITYRTIFLAVLDII